MKTILLTGANGFIGHYFTDTYHSTYNIKPFSFLRDDFNTLHYYNIDTIVHLSALVHQMKGANYDAYKKINVDQTLDLALKAKKSGVTHFIYMSTIKVYGEESDVPYTEISPCHPVDNYGRTKLLAEQELQRLENQNFTVSIIRTPIVYGYGVKANMQNLIKLIQITPILPFADIHNLRSMVYIGNLCALLQRIIETKKEGIFLASDNEPLSTTALIHKIAYALEVKCHLVTIPFFASLLRRLKPSLYQRLYGNLIVDNTLTKQQLNFQNPYSLDEGIKLMIKGNS